MAEKTKGYVNYVGSTKFKGKELWSFRITNSDSWFRTGLVKPPIEKGNLVEFESTEVNGGHNVDVSSIAVIATSDSVTVGGVGSLGNRGNASANGRETYWEDRAKEDRARDLRIQYQSARKDAIAVVDILVREKALKLPEKLGAAHDAILGKIDDLTDHYFKASNREQVVDGDSPEESSVRGS